MSHHFLGHGGWLAQGWCSGLGVLRSSPCQEASDRMEEVVPHTHH